MLSRFFSDLSFEDGTKIYKIEIFQLKVIDNFVVNCCGRILEIIVLKKCYNIQISLKFTTVGMLILTYEKL